MTQESKVITGSGYLLYSAESVHTRFAANPQHETVCGGFPLTI
jgi:hypothetical protein